MEFKEFMDKYTEFFNIVFTFVIPMIKLFAVGVGLWLLIDIQWIIHQIRSNAEGYQFDNGKGAE